MKKPTAISLVFLFILTVLLSGASGYSDCAAECAYEMAKAHPHSAMGPAKLTAPNCCSGALKNTCEMDRTVEIKIPECSTACHAPVSSKPISIGFFYQTISEQIVSDLPHLTCKSALMKKDQNDLSI